MSSPRRYWSDLKSEGADQLHEIKMDVHLCIYSEKEAVEWQEMGRTDVGEFESDVNLVLETLQRSKVEKLVLTGFCKEQIDEILPYIKEHVKVK